MWRLIYLMALRAFARLQCIMNSWRSRLLVTDILHFLDVVDAFGHVSVRNPDNASQFIMSFAIAPALATSQSLVTYEIENATAIQLTFNTSVTGDAVPTGFIERYIHSQIYKAFPNVAGVVHAHTLNVISFAAVGVGLKAQVAPAGSVGALSDGTPIFNYDSLPASILPESASHNLLIVNEGLGDALADTFQNGSAVVLMKGHGMVVQGASVRNVVFESYYTMQSAEIQMAATLLGGLAPSGLSPRNAMDAAATVEKESLLDRAWDLWTAQVDQLSLYVNDLRS
ncbi:arad-like aldolase/epimerase [Gymnopus androsaceus JB14]|uniref:Arad-like aldolase/epimerase n=1 Tax=Gymnopus androsaceus JB14 TaxID=1447944 RepID=A0A6A4I170_9AGAR|nr:arad-like aldolase/epimerase [Gymnopus androsaceus JB14]